MYDVKSGQEDLRVERSEFSPVLSRAAFVSRYKFFELKRMHLIPFVAGFGAVTAFVCSFANGTTAFEHFGMDKGTFLLSLSPCVTLKTFQSTVLNRHANERKIESMSVYQKQISGLEYEKRDIYAEQNEDPKSEGHTWDEIRKERRRGKQQRSSSAGRKKRRGSFGGYSLFYFCCAFLFIFFICFIFVLPYNVKL